MRAAPPMDFRGWPTQCCQLNVIMLKHTCSILNCLQQFRSSKAWSARNGWIEVKKQRVANRKSYSKRNVIQALRNIASR